MKEKTGGLRQLYDFLLTVAILATATVLCTLLRRLDDGSGYVSLIFVLAVATIPRDLVPHRAAEGGNHGIRSGCTRCSGGRTDR